MRWSKSNGAGEGLRRGLWCLLRAGQPVGNSVFHMSLSGHDGRAAIAAATNVDKPQHRRLLRTPAPQNGVFSSNCIKTSYRGPQAPVVSCGFSSCSLVAHRRRMPQSGRAARQPEHRAS